MNYGISYMGSKSKILAPLAMNYGIPYMGSKSKILAALAMNFPKADNFYDLFGGGFSVSHYMLKNMGHKYKHIYYNEIEADIVGLVKKAINGKFNYDSFKPEWISKAEFDKEKSNNAYMRICWSFGNDQKGYLFSTKIEPYKRSIHRAVIFNQFDEISRSVIGNCWPEGVNCVRHKRFYIRQKIDYYIRANSLPEVLKQFLSRKQLQQIQQLERHRQLPLMQQLQRLERLQQLQRLQNLERLHFSSKSYDNVDIKPNSIVYCDIPYKNTRSYLGDFDHKIFFDWAATRKYPVYISEYNIEDDRFKLVFQIDKVARFINSQETKKTMIEKLYWNGVA